MAGNTVFILERALDETKRMHSKLGINGVDKAWWFRDEIYTKNTILISDFCSLYILYKQLEHEISWRM